MVKIETFVIMERGGGVSLVIFDRKKRFWCKNTISSLIFSSMSGKLLFFVLLLSIPVNISGLNGNSLTENMTPLNCIMLPKKQNIR